MNLHTRANKNNKKMEQVSDGDNFKGKINFLWFAYYQHFRPDFPEYPVEFDDVVKQIKESLEDYPLSWKDFREDKIDYEITKVVIFGCFDEGYEIDMTEIEERLLGTNVITSVEVTIQLPCQPPIEVNEQFWVSDEVSYLLNNIDMDRWYNHIVQLSSWNRYVRCNKVFVFS